MLVGPLGPSRESDRQTSVSRIARCIEDRVMSLGFFGMLATLRGHWGSILDSLWSL